MLRLLGDPELRRQVGQIARSFAKRYDWDVIGREWEEMYAQAIRQSLSAVESDQGDVGGLRIANWESPPKADEEGLET
jgi:hypothetical protein